MQIFHYKNHQLYSYILKLRFHYLGYKPDKKVYINKELTFENTNIENNKIEYNFKGIGVGEN